MIVTEGQSQGRRNLAEDDVLRHEKKRAFSFAASRQQNTRLRYRLTYYPETSRAIYTARYIPLGWVLYFK